MGNKGTKLIIFLLFAAIMVATGGFGSFVSAKPQQDGKGRRVSPKDPYETQIGRAETPLELMRDPDANAARLEVENGGRRIGGVFDTRIIRFDVAENAKRFVFDETPLFEDGAPAYGNEFVTEGYIYPYGTLTDSNGVNPDGSPEFPDRVIGRWTCRGWHVGEGAKTETGPWVVTQQLYDFGVRPGQVTIATDGYEVVDLNEPVLRAIIGGTGPYALIRGEATQTMIGFNQLGGVNLRYELRVIVR